MATAVQVRVWETSSLSAAASAPFAHKRGCKIESRQQSAHHRPKSQSSGVCMRTHSTSHSRHKQRKISCCLLLHMQVTTQRDVAATNLYQPWLDEEPSQDRTATHAQCATHSAEQHPRNLTHTLLSGSDNWHTNHLDFTDLLCNRVPRCCARQKCCGSETRHNITLATSTASTARSLCQFVHSSVKTQTSGLREYARRFECRKALEGTNMQLHSCSTLKETMPLMGGERETDQIHR